MTLKTAFESNRIEFDDDFWSTTTTTTTTTDTTNDQKRRSNRNWLRRADDDVRDSVPAKRDKKTEYALGVVMLWCGNALIGAMVSTLHQDYDSCWVVLYRFFRFDEKHHFRFTHTSVHRSADALDWDFDGLDDDTTTTTTNNSNSSSNANTTSGVATNRRRWWCWWWMFVWCVSLMFSFAAVVVWHRDGFCRTLATSSTKGGGIAKQPKYPREL